MHQSMSNFAPSQTQSHLTPAAVTTFNPYQYHSNQKQELCAPQVLRSVSPIRQSMQHSSSQSLVSRFHIDKEKLLKE